jgi:asparagine synthase (glutamine-hydrolysing)
MCGIAGIIDYSGCFPIKDSVHGMVDYIRHRGPDGRGQFVRDNVALGHARLSIIDLAGGAQPMPSDDGMLHVTFNGEIYNFRELRELLRRKGHSFQTESDTEVVLYAYREWGKRCVDHLEGMFAFGIADFSKRELFLARDPFGIKPLLYRVQDGSFVFASEFQAFWALPDWSGEIDLQSIDYYLRYQYIPAPNTAYRKLFKLPAGHCMTVRMGESHQKIERYWEPDFSKKQRISDNDLDDLLDETLRDSVCRHLVADVPFGALLSGGVDSSLVVGYMVEILGRPVKTFSIGFEDEKVNELPYARQVAQKYETDHHEEIVRFDALDILPKLVKHHGEPFGDQSAIPTWYVSKLARSEVPMVLSGDGGDELFAGYGTYGNWKRKVMQASPEVTPDWKSRVRPLVKKVLPSRYAVSYRPDEAPDLWTDCVIRFNSGERESLWRPELKFLSDSTCMSFENAFSAGLLSTDVNRPQRADLETFLPEDIMCKVDISSMSHGLEVRPPILDRRVFEVCRRINSAQLYSSELSTSTYIGKRPLKNMAAKKLGTDFSFRSKQGFELPLQKWFTSKAGSALVRERLLAPDAQILQWFEQSALQHNIDRGHVVNTWLLLVLEEWLGQVQQAKLQALN